MTEATRPPPAQRLRSAPAVVWLYGALALAVAPYVGIVLNERAATDPVAWTGVTLGLLLTAGLALRWQVVWPVAFAVDLFLLGAAVLEVARNGAIALPFLVKGVLALGLLLSASMRVHVFGSVEWRDEDTA